MDLVDVPISISAVCERRAAILQRMSIRTPFFLLASFVVSIVCLSVKSPVSVFAVTNSTFTNVV